MQCFSVCVASLNGIDGKLGWFIFKIALTEFCLIIRIIEKFVDHGKPKEHSEKHLPPHGLLSTAQPSQRSCHVHPLLPGERRPEASSFRPRLCLGTSIGQGL